MKQLAAQIQEEKVPMQTIKYMHVTFNQKRESMTLQINKPPPDSSTHSRQDRALFDSLYGAKDFSVTVIGEADKQQSMLQYIFRCFQLQQLHHRGGLQ